MSAESINIDKDTSPFVKSTDASEWYNATTNKSYVFSGDEAKSFNLIFKNESAKTDSFLRAEGDGASIVVKNLDSLEFLTTTALKSDRNNNNPIITSNGGTVTFDNINHVKFGNAETPLQVDQIAHLNWNGGDVKFSNIGTIDAYSRGTAFMVQSQPKAFPSLIFENVDTVNIHSDERIGIQIAASSTIDQTKQYTPLDVKNVNNFNVYGAISGMEITNKSADSKGEYWGSSDFKLDINAKNINIEGGERFGVTTYLFDKTGLTPSKLALNLTGDTIKIKSSADQAAAIYAANTQTQSSKNVSVSLNAKQVVLSASDTEGSAIRGSNASVKVNADELTLNGYYSIDTRGKKGNEVELASRTENGTITVNSNGKVSLDQASTLRLTNAEFKSGEGKQFFSAGTLELNNSNVEMNGGTFDAATVTGSGDSSITLNDAKSTVTVTDNQKKDLVIAAGGALNDTFNTPEEATAALKKATTIKNNENAGGSNSFAGQSGALSDTWTADNDGNITSRTTNQSLDAFGNYNAMTLVQWRNEVNHISQRLGDVRDSSTTIGAWARVYGYDSSYDDNVSIDFKANSIQAGGDYRVNNTWLVGGAFSYTDGEGKFSNGSADSDGYSLAAYLTGFFDCGAYVDFVGRVGRLSTDITAYSDASEFKGSYNNTTFGLSAEVGYHWKFNDTFYVEPQAELAYGFVKGDDFTGANDVRVEQDDFQTLVGRLGARIGASFADGAGTVYAHASVNHDFLGDADYTASLGSASRDLSVDIGGTWVSYGIGAQFNTTKNLNFYGTLERANGSEYQEDYRYSVGMSYRF
ncbi:autotransporter outer membrane beta-barrel domain-containing protein [Sutterella wadsworthensis]|uniref:autotransporter outer membrane beta-barrel domain-containing protein n=2 Tax=Sutterella wadsworthensis TaxID=40545 RepID=UPI001F0E5D7A|nr:autotransporter outer membrane beta-barrel domain-containing protein [Sutterella wadsworthensis]